LRPGRRPGERAVRGVPGVGRLTAARRCRFGTDGRPATLAPTGATHATREPEMTSTSSDAVPITERLPRWANQHRKWLFAAPAMAFTAVLICFPIGWTLYLSLTDAKGSVRRPADFIGVANYADVLTDTDRFWPAVART